MLFLQEALYIFNFFVTIVINLYLKNKGWT